MENIIVALIGAMGAIIVPFVQHLLKSSTPKKKTIAIQGLVGLIIGVAIGIGVAPFIMAIIAPTVSITSISDEQGRMVEKNTAPFVVEVRGVAEKTKGKYVYLIVKDARAEWIEPGLGRDVTGEFEARAYLGVRDDPASIGTSYTIFTVVTDKPFQQYEHLDRETIKAESKHIRLTRSR